MRFHWTILVCVTLVTVAALLAACGFGSTIKIAGSSMEPTYHDGQVVKTEGITSVISRGDVIVFKPPFLADYVMLSRVIGLPGEAVELREGHVFINGTRLYENPDFGIGREVSLNVPDNDFFVLGDNRSNSRGSSEGWTVPRENITKRVVDTEGTYGWWFE